MDALDLFGAELPRHIAIIMDGNGRWAKARGLERLEGHRAGALSVRRTVEECRRLGIRYVTLYSFSTENWRRSPEEVDGLMKLLREYLDTELDTLARNNVRLRAIGELSQLPLVTRTALQRTIDRTADNEGMDLVLALSYGGRREIVHAARQLCRRVREGNLDEREIDEETFKRELWTHDIPDPELVIRTSGEMRVSNFLLWQIAYAEFVFVPQYWPDFDEQLLHKCLLEYKCRERRLGLSGEQLRHQMHGDKREC